MFVGFSMQGQRAFALVSPEYIETKVIGSAGLDSGSVIKSDSQDNLYISGLFNQGTLDFNPGEGIDNFTNAFATYDIFLTKYNSDGTYAWTKTWGGTGSDGVYDLAFDSDDNIYLATEFFTTVDFDPGEGEDIRTSAGSVDIALIKINADGSYGWTKTMGSTSHDRLQTIQIASDDSVYIAGKFNLTFDFDPSEEGVDIHTSAGSYDMFFSKFNTDGSYVWTKTWGGTGSGDSVNKIALDSNNNIFLTGCLTGTVDFDPSEEGIDVKISNGSNDVFLTKYNSDGTYAWTKTWGGTTNDFGFAVTVNSNNDIYVAGSFQLTVDLDPSEEGINNVTSIGSEDISISKFTNDGIYDFSYTWGGTGMDGFYSIDFDEENNWYVGGIFSGTIDFDPSVAGEDIIAPVGPHDMAFVVFDENDNYLLTKSFGSSNPTETTWYDEYLNKLSISGNNLYLTGFYIDTTDFDPEATTDEYTSVVNSRDIFYTTYNLVFLPAVVTSSATTLTQTGAILNGEITNTGGGDATTRGFNWGLSDSYGTTATESSGPYGTEVFTTTLSDLNCDTTYHYRAFATNVTGTVYGSDVSLTTNDCPSSSGSRARPKSTPPVPVTVVTPDAVDALPATPVIPVNKPACLISLTLRQGSRGEQVRCLQTKLNITSDGIFGPITKASVINFQKAHLLVPDGIVGPITRGEMNKI